MKIQVLYIHVTTGQKERGGRGGEPDKHWKTQREKDEEGGLQERYPSGQIKRRRKRKAITPKARRSLRFIHLLCAYKFI